MRCIITWIIIILLPLFSNGNDTPSQFSHENISEVRNNIIKLIEARKFASMSIAVSRDGSIVWNEAFGMADIENKVPATPHTKYRLASITKTMTATGIMILNEDQMIDLDRPLSDYVPEIKLRYYVGVNNEITIRHLLNHRSGIPSYCDFFFEDRTKTRDFLTTIDRYGIVVFQPGWSYIYSNLGYEILGYLIAKVSKSDYASFLTDELFIPLGMTNTSVTCAGEEVTHYAKSYTPDFHPIPNFFPYHPGANGVYCSSHDLLRFAMFHLKDHLQDQKAVISDDSIDKMQAIVSESNTRYGLGWSLDTNDLGQKIVYHGGSEPGTHNLMVLIPSQDIAIVILCNSDCGAHLLGTYKAISQALLPDLSKIRNHQTESAVSDSAQSSSDSEEVPTPSGFVGDWEGKIENYAGSIDVALSMKREGKAHVLLEDHQPRALDIAVLSDTFLLGSFPAEVPISDLPMRSKRVRLAVVREGNRLWGQATAERWEKERQMKYELSSWIELKKIQSD